MDGIETGRSKHKEEIKEKYVTGFMKGLQEAEKKGKALGELEYVMRNKCSKDDKDIVRDEGDGED